MVCVCVCVCVKVEEKGEEAALYKCFRGGEGRGT